MLQLLVFMNLTGSIFFILHILFIPLEKKYMPPQYRVYIYRLNLLYFIVPFPVCLFYIRRYFEAIIVELPILSFAQSGTHFIVHLEENANFALPRLNHFEILFLFVWIAVMIYLYRQFSAEKHRIRNFNSTHILFQEEETDQNSFNTSKLVDIAQKELKLKRKPQIVLQEGAITPHVSGILRPTLCLPYYWDIPESIYYMIIKHELSHIRHKDLLFQRIAFIAKIVNWFNPILYLICRKMADCDELAADACACDSASKADRKAYLTAILDLASNQTNSPYSSMKGLGIKLKRKNIILERALIMKNKNLCKHKSIKLITATLMSIIIFSLSVIPALAYKLPSTLEIRDKANFVTPTEMINVDNLSSKGDSSPELISPIPAKNDINLLTQDFDFSQSDYLCIEENGIIYYGTVGLQNESCRHSYDSVGIVHHNKYSDGNCTTIHYNGNRCAKCSHIKILKKIASVTYEKCPH